MLVVSVLERKFGLRCAVSGNVPGLTPLDLPQTYNKYPPKMPAIAPETKYNQLILSINDRLRTGKPVTESDFFWFGGLKRDAEKLLKADAARGHIALAALMQLKWDEEKANFHIRCANAAHPSIETKKQEFTLLSNFGRFSKALTLLDEILDPRNGFFASNYLAALSCGAFQALSINQRKAEEMDVNLSGLPTDTVNKVANIFGSAGITDKQTAEALDIAGELLRGHQLFWIGESVDVAVDDDPDHLPTVFFTFQVRTSVKTAAAMTFELYERLLTVYPDHPSCLNIGFRSKVVE